METVEELIEDEEDYDPAIGSGSEDNKDNVN